MYQWLLAAIDHHMASIRLAGDLEYRPPTR
jgi:hypothetical protein